MTDQRNKQSLELPETPEIQERRAFLRGLGKWSQVVIGGVLLGGLTVSQRASAGAWVNRRGGYGGGGWINGGGGGGGGWINRRGYGGGGWINRY